jgi:hypothetical protein
VLPTNRVAAKVPEVQIMLLAIGAVLLVLWGLGYIAYRVTSGLIHLLLIIGLILLVLHFLRR